MESNVTKMPGIEILPEELLVEISKYLSLEDRLNCATAGALTDPQLLKDIWFTVRREGIGRAAPVLIKSCRRYPNLRLVEVHLSEFDSEFWGKAGKTLRRLELNGCTWKPEVLYDIFRECSSLEYLSMTRIDVRNTLPESVGTCGISVEDVRASLSNVKHLHLSTYSVDVVLHLLGLIPHTSSISLNVSGREFRWETFIHRILADSRIVTGLDLGRNSTSDADLILIIGAFSGTLRELRIDCSLLTNRAGAAIAGCSKLRRLSLERFRELESAPMTTILRSNPSLEMLSLKYCTSLTDDGLSPIFELRKLRRLTIYGCPAITNEFWCRMGEILALEYLDLDCTTLDSKTTQSIACLKNLKGLCVENYIQSPESLRLICMNLEKLQTLDLGNCRDLSDADGLMLSRLKRLRTLSVRNAFGFKDLTLEGGIEGPKLESLSVCGSSLTDLGLLSLVDQHGRLKDITLRFCMDITDQGLVTLLPRAPLLETLTLSHCHSIGDRFIKTLADSCPRLYDVDILDCATRYRAVESFRERRPTVRVDFETYESESDWNVLSDSSDCNDLSDW